MAKKHAPITQLREAAKEAQRLLVERGIHTKESSVDRILKENKVMLPGIPAYLPHRWTLEAARRMVVDMIHLWVAKNKSNQKKQENTTEFFKFLVSELSKIEGDVKKKVEAMPDILKSLKGTTLLSKVFSPFQRMETTNAITRFLIDSFAVSMVVKEHGTTTEFAEWFLKWTKELEDYWIRKEQKDGHPLG